MIRSISLKLDAEESQPLIETLRLSNQAFNICSAYGFNNQISSKNKIHHGTYRLIRKQFPKLPSALVQTIRDTASEALKGCKLKSKPVKQPLSGIRYDKRTANLKLATGQVSLSSVKGRIKGLVVVPRFFHERYRDWAPRGCVLQQRRGQFYLNVFLEKEAPKFRKRDSVIGVDRGINNVAVCSDNSFYDSREIHRVKNRYSHLRKQLQAKGTRSAKRKLKRLSGREKRFVRNQNQLLANEIVAKPFNVIALEDLRGIRAQKHLGRKFNRKLSNWSYGELVEILNYKAEALGKRVVFVDPKYTSQKCSRCGFTKRSNRKLSEFKCGDCSLALHADLNASRNIALAGRSGLGRFCVNEPIVAVAPIEIKPVTSPLFM